MHYTSASDSVGVAGVPASPGPRGIFVTPSMLTRISTPSCSRRTEVSVTERTRNGPSVLGKSLTESSSVLVIPCARVRRSTLVNGGRAIDVDKIACPDDRTEADFLVKIVLIPLSRCG